MQLVINKIIMINMKLSIVVPVYNVEKYVRKCVLSIISQDDNLFKDIELIIVNDGTKDKSIEQIQDLVDKYDNIMLINQENLSLSVARNNGMAKAKGDYVWFVDSDDWLSKDALKILMPHLDNVNDIITIAYTKVTESEETVEGVSFNEIKTLSGKDTFRQRCVFGTMAQRGIYRKKFLTKNSLTFMPGVYNQDDELCLRASYFANTITLLPQSIYYFLRTSGDHKSIMNTVNPKLGFDYLTVSKSLVNFSNEHVKEKDILKRFNCHISVLINCGLNAISKCSEADQYKFIEMYRRIEGLNKCYYKGGGKYLVEGILFSMFPRKMVKIYKLLKSSKI